MRCKVNDQKKCVVHSDYSSAFPDPFKLVKGERLKTSDRKSDWEGWIWCTAQSGKRGWVPTSYLVIENESAILKQDYDATEMNVSSGEELIIVFEEAGWAWCMKDNGEAGWVPLDNLKSVKSKIK